MLQLNINLKIIVQLQIFSANTMSINQQVHMKIYMFSCALVGFIPVAKQQCMAMKYLKCVCHVHCCYPSWSPVYFGNIRQCQYIFVFVPTVVPCVRSWVVQNFFFLQKRVAFYFTSVNNFSRPSCISYSKSITLNHEEGSLRSRIFILLAASKLTFVTALESMWEAHLSSAPVGIECL